MTGIINEEWRSISGYINYQVSNIGRVRNVNTARILCPRLEKTGYHRIGLCKNGIQHIFLTHRLVAIEFIDNPNNKEHVDHIDGNKINNTILNLRWVNRSQNMMNSRKRMTNASSTYKGVTFDKRTGKWKVGITVNKNRIHLGYFENEKDAAREYNEACEQYHCEFAQLNIISEDEDNDEEEDDDSEDEEED